MAHDESAFPWDVGVFDAHCHPTDTMASIASIPAMKAATLTIMATRGEDQELVRQTTEAHVNRVMPCFGWHPWFSHQIIDDSIDQQEQDAEQQKTTHYEAVLTPSPEDDEAFIQSLPPPKHLSTLISETKERLLSFPNALVGEIGLDKSFRLPSAWTAQDLDDRNDQVTPGSREGRRLSPYKVKLDHQRTVLKAQLRLAGELARAVSVHSVQAHGAIFELFKELWTGHERVVISRREREKQQDAEGAVSADEDEDGEEEKADTTKPATGKQQPFPPRICLHSYSGPVEPLRQFLHRANPSDVYFSFSSVINFTGSSASSRRVSDVIKALPEDRVLVESDLHTAGPQMDELLEQAASQICEIRGWELRRGVQQLADNWRRFVFG